MQTQSNITGNGADIMVKLELDGYFDNNFGDDYIIKIIVNSLPDVRFVIDSSKHVPQLILNEKNVSVSDTRLDALPKLLVIGTGFMINSFGSLICEIKWYLKNKYIADYCVGCSIEPFDHPIKEYLVKKKLQKFKLIVCRDKKSRQWLEKSCKHTQIFCLPDIMFSIPQAWLKSDRCPSKLGIAMLHRAVDKPDCTYYRAMAETADFWVKTTGEDVYLMAFNTGSEDDVFSCECVKNLMKFGCKAKIVCHGSNSEIINACSKCRKIVGARFHSGVLALKMGIDFFPVIYREKMYRLIEDMGYPQKGCRIDCIDLNEIKTFLVNRSVGFRLDGSIVSEAQKYADIIREYITEGSDMM